MYINELEDAISENSIVALYADDIKLYTFVKHEDDAIKLQEVLNKINVWIRGWQLSLN